MSQKTGFHDIRGGAIAVYRVTTESSVYIVGFHEERGRRLVIVRGQPGTDREHVVIRDSDPRIGEHSMFAVPPEDWIGKLMEVATMTSSAVVAVIVETDRAAIASVGGDAASARSPWARPEPVAERATKVPAPAGLSEHPRIVGGLGRGTHPLVAGGEPGLAQKLVVGHAAPVNPPAGVVEPEAPYPKRHVRYAEDAASRLRSIAKRERLYDDLAGDRELRDRLRKALDDCADLLEQIRRRDRR